MNAFEWQAMQIEQAAALVGNWIATTREDRLNWQPKADEASDSRSVMDLAQECIQVHHSLAATLSGAAPAAQSPVQPTGAADAQEQLISSARKLAAVVRTLDDGVLGRTFQTPRGELPGSLLVSLAVNHMMYHGGQINYIQRLYGDMEFHLPRRPGR